MNKILINNIAFIFLFVGTLSLASSQKIYIEPKVSAAQKAPLSVQKDIFVVHTEAKWYHVGRYSYDQSGNGFIFSFHNLDSSVLVENLNTRVFYEYKAPCSLRNVDYFFYNDSTFYFISTNNAEWIKWKVGDEKVVKQNIYPPSKDFAFVFESGYITQPLVSPNGKFVLLPLIDMKKDYLKVRSLDAYVNLETGQSYLVNMPFTDKYLQGWFLNTATYNREWLTDSTIVYSFQIDESLYVINVNTGKIQRFDGRSQFQTETIKPHSTSRKQPNKDEFDEFYRYKDYYFRMVLNRERGEVYRIYKKKTPEKNEKGEFTTRADKEHSIVVFDLDLNKKGEVDMPVSEHYAWRFAPSKNGLFYDLFIDLKQYKIQPYEKFMEIRFND